MTRMQYTRHFEGMLKERGIEKSWVERTIAEPDKVEDCPDGTKHFLKQISEYESRWLRVIVNTTVVPNKSVTVFFDRRLKGKQ